MVWSISSVQFCSIQKLHNIPFECNKFELRSVAWNTCSPDGATMQQPTLSSSASYRPSGHGNARKDKIIFLMDLCNDWFASYIPLFIHLHCLNICLILLVPFFVPTFVRFLWNDYNAVLLGSLGKCVVEKPTFPVTVEIHSLRM